MNVGLNVFNFSKTKAHGKVPIHKKHSEGHSVLQIKLQVP